LTYNFSFRREEKFRKSANLFEISGFQNVLDNNIQKLKDTVLILFLLGILLVKAKGYCVFESNDKLLAIRCGIDLKFHI